VVGYKKFLDTVSPKSYLVFDCHEETLTAATVDPQVADLQQERNRMLAEAFASVMYMMADMSAVTLPLVEVVSAPTAALSTMLAQLTVPMISSHPLAPPSISMALT